MGRFLTPDSIIPQPGNPQDWDRYAYVRNDPINATDPSGHRPCDWEGVGRECQGQAIPRYPKRSFPVVSLPASFQFPAFYGPPAPPVYIQTVSGGLVIGQNSGPVIANYSNDYPGDAVNSGNEYFFVNNYNPRVPCNGLGCVPQVLDTAYRIAGPLLPNRNIPMDNNVSWNFDVRHSGGYLSPGNINFSTSVGDDPVFVRNVTYESGDQTVDITNSMRIDPKLGANNMFDVGSQSFSGHNPLTVSIAIQCAGCVNFGNGPTSFVWRGTETIIYVKVH